MLHSEACRYLSHTLHGIIGSTAPCETDGEKEL